MDGDSRVADGLFGRGFVATMPLWTGAVPVGMAYGAAARDAGLDAGQAQLMSLVVFSAAAQLFAVSALVAEEPTGVVVGTAVALNVSVLLLGTTIERAVRVRWWERLVAAWVLTEGAYGVAAAGGRVRLPTLIGSGTSMFLAWNVGTAIGTIGGGALPAARGLGLDLVAPLTFLAVLVPLVRTRPAVLTALSAATTAMALGRVAPVGIAVLGAGLLGGAVGAWAGRAGVGRGREGGTGGQPR